MTPQEAHRLLLLREGEVSISGDRRVIPDLSGYDADTLRTLIESLYKRVHQLEFQLSNERAEQEELRLHVADLRVRVNQAERGAVVDLPDQSSISSDQEIPIYTSLQGIIDLLPEILRPKDGRWDPSVQGALSDAWFRANVRGYRFKATIRELPRFVAGREDVLKLYFATGEVVSLSAWALTVHIHADLHLPMSMLTIGKISSDKPMVIEGDVSRIRIDLGRNKRTGQQTGDVYVSLSDCVRLL